MYQLNNTPGRLDYNFVEEEFSMKISKHIAVAGPDLTLGRLGISLEWKVLKSDFLEKEKIHTYF